MTSAPPYPRYPRGEEIANSLTHGAGLVLAITGLVFLVLFTSWHGTARHIVSAATGEIGGEQFGGTQGILLVRGRIRLE